ncbi:hypothetical protein ACFDR9_004248 [Janthinobacterium sp. CG_23.3]|uniref:hypothetical protein n=1 Tax=unclassified Janthinobacterium TaxID=2610881 RepID=UPI0003463E1B|nr:MULTISPECIES: hypothetical protein [unclassified Janthinobacterium]MEC5163100.1 hypothetical protein [Janthinobacterium sp. CG_S6]
MGRLPLAWLGLFCLLCGGAAAGQGLRPLDDGELSAVRGGDGVAFAAHIVINDPTLVGAVSDSRLSLGFKGDGQSNYLVIKNLRGSVDMFAFSIGVNKKPDGGDYVALGLPGYVKFSNFGFESLSVQSDPLAPVASSLGSLNIHGGMALQGQFRLWAH